MPGSTQRSGGHGAQGFAKLFRGDRRKESVVWDKVIHDAHIPLN